MLRGLPILCGRDAGRGCGDDERNQLGVLTLIHCEDACVISSLPRRLVAHGRAVTAHAGRGRLVRRDRTRPL